MTHLGSHLGTSHHSAIVGSLAAHGYWSSLWKLNGGDAGTMVQGHLGPLGLMYHLVMAWAINCWPSPRLTGLVLSCACLPTQLVAPNNMNVVFHTSPKLSPSLEQDSPAWASHYCFRPDLPTHTMSSTTGTCQACGVVVLVPQSLVEITCISKQYQVSGQSGIGFLTRDWGGEWEGHYQMLLSLQSHSSHLVV